MLFGLMFFAVILPHASAHVLLHFPTPLRRLPILFIYFFATTAGTSQPLSGRECHQSLEP